MSEQQNPQQTLLDGPCIFCGFNGDHYWKMFSHCKDCPWRLVAGPDARWAMLRDVMRPAFWKLAALEEKARLLDWLLNQVQIHKLLGRYYLPMEIFDRAADTPFEALRDAYCTIPHVIERNGETYVFAPDHNAPDARFLHWEIPQAAAYLLVGGHDGPPITVRVEGIDEEFDEDGKRTIWQQVKWADQSWEVIEDPWLLDAYSDAITEDLNVPF